MNFAPGPTAASRGNGRRGGLPLRGDKSAADHSVFAVVAGAFAAVRVWVDAPTVVRKERALSRDGETYAPH